MDDTKDTNDELIEDDAHERTAAAAGAGHGENDQPPAVVVLAKRDENGSAIDIRSVALTCIFLLALFHTLYVAKTLVFPMLLAVLAYFCLIPVVRTLTRFKIPAPLGAAAVVIGVLAVVVTGVYFLSSPASSWASRLPRSLTRIERDLREVREPIEQLVAAADEVEDMAEVDDDRTVQKVEVRNFSLAESILDQTRALLTTIATVLVLLYFLLASGDAFFIKIAQVVPQVTDKAKAKQLIFNTEAEISHYLFTITAINTCLGIATAVVLWALEMPNPILWGVCAGTFNFVPFLGPTAMTAILFGVAVLHYGNFAEALFAPLLFMIMTSLEGMIITPTVLGHRLALSPVAVFASLLIWSWLWGIPGALIAVPTLATIKIACDQIGSLRVLGTILGR